MPTTNQATNETIQLPILCFNDVYRVTQRYVPQPGAPPIEPAFAAKLQDKGEAAKINVAQFGRMIYDLRATWPSRSNTIECGAVGKSQSDQFERPSSDGKDDEREGKEPTAEKDGMDALSQKDRDGLLLFAGDVFNPSVESSVTRGSHMVPVLNMLGIDVSCIGNHDFDFGYPHMTKLLASTNFPWLLSNIIDINTGEAPVPLRKYWVTERCGVKIGVVGLVEEDWIVSIPAWPENFKYRPMDQVAIELSKELRDPAGEAVDLIIALTHSRVNNDIKLCQQVGAVSDRDVSQEHGLDLVIGGHDHMYYIGKGAKSWQGYTGDGAGGTSADTACHLIKSGTDFRDLSSATLTLTRHTSPSAVRKTIISSIEGKHHYIMPESPSMPEYEELIEGLMSTVGETLGKPVAYTLTEFDALSENVRSRETGLGNWVADVLLHAYAESGVDKRGIDARAGKESGGKGDETPKPGNTTFTKDGDNSDSRDNGGADCVIICGGGLRGDSRYGPGKVTMGDILEILPYEDPIVCIELDGKGIRDTIEHGLSKWPAQEGRFPIIAGLSVEWDHSLPPYQRVKSIHFAADQPDYDDEEDEFDPLDMVDFVEAEDGQGTRVEVKGRKVEKGEPLVDEKVYRVITREYMATGGDGFGMLKNRKFIVDDENGQPASSILRSFLLGSSYIFRHKELMFAHSQHLSTRTRQVLDRARAKDARAGGRNSSYSGSPSSSLANSPDQRYSALSPALSPGGASNASTLSDKSGTSSHLFGTPSMNGSAMGSQLQGSGWNSLRRHVVQHDRKSIRDALLVGRTEHMSAVDSCAGDEMRSFTPGKPNSLSIGKDLDIDKQQYNQDQSVKASRALEPRAPVPGTGSRQAGPFESASIPAPSLASVAPKKIDSNTKRDGNGAGNGAQGDKIALTKTGQAAAKAIQKEVEEDERKQRQGVLMRDDLVKLGGELAIICPLVDGRMRDLAA